MIIIIIIIIIIVIIIMLILILIEEEKNDYAAKDLTELIGLNYGRQVFSTRGKHTTKTVLTTGNPVTRDNIGK